MVAPALRALLVCVLGAVVAPATAPAADYTLAITPQFEQRKLFESWRPIADELERRTGHRFSLLTTLSTREFEREFLGGGFDFAFVNPYFVAKTQRTLGYVPLVRDRVLVQGILVARKGGAIRSPGDLKGKRVAFPTPNAVGACMLVRAELRSRFGVEVEPVFVKTVSNVALHVAKGLVDAGGLPDKALALLDPAVVERLEILLRVPPVVPHAVAAHSRVPVADREAVRKALLDLAATDAGKALLAKVPMKEAVAATQEEYAAVGKMGLERWYAAGLED